MPAIVEKSREKILATLPTSFRDQVDRFQRSIILAYNKDHKLQKCTPESVMMAAYRACELGLRVNTENGHAYLIPYGNECKLIIGYRGIIELAYRTKLYNNIEGRTVGKGDQWVCRWTPRLEFLHEPADDQDPNQAVRVYSMIWMKNNPDPLINVMSRLEVEAVRKSSRSGNEGPWVTWWGQQAIKTVLKRGLKTLPKSDELERAIEFDNEDYRGTLEAPRPRGVAGLVQQIQAADQPAVTQEIVQESTVATNDPHGLLDDADGWEDGRE